MARPPAGSGFSIVPHIQRRRATPGVHKCTVKTRSHFRFFKTTYWRCARKCKVGLLETLGNYCALQYAGRCCGKQHRKPDIKNWALKPGVLRVSELWTLEAERPLGAAAAGAPHLATGAEPTRLASFWHVHLGDQVHVTRELIYLRLRRRCSGAAQRRRTMLRRRRV